MRKHTILIYLSTVLHLGAATKALLATQEDVPSQEVRTTNLTTNITEGVAVDTNTQPAAPYRVAPQERRPDAPTQADDAPTAPSEPDPPDQADSRAPSDYLPLVQVESVPSPTAPPPSRREDDWRPPARWAATTYRYLLYQKLDIGVRTTQHTLHETQRGKPFEDSFIGSIDQLRLLPDESPRYHVVLRYAPIPYAGIGYQTDQLVIRTQTSLPREQRSSDRDTDGNLIIKGAMPFIFARYNWNNWIEPYVEYGRASYDNRFDPDPWWDAGGRREFVVADSKASYWSFGIGLTIYRHFLIDVYTRTVDMDVDAVYYFRGDDREPEPFTFPASHRTYGATAAIRF